MSDMALHEAIFTQRAIRAFTEDPVSDEDVNDLLEAAVRAPSGGNRQPWHFVVLRDPEKKAAVRDSYLKSWNAYKERVAAQAPARPEAAATLERWRKDPAGDRFAENLDKVPVLIIPCLDMRVLSFGDDPLNPSVMTMNSVYASIFPAVQNLLLTARAKGLGAVLTTLHCQYEDEVKRALGIPAYVRTACMIPIGHPAAPYGPTRRIPPGERTHPDGWNAALAGRFEAGRGVLRVADRMTADPVTCTPDDLVYDLDLLMQKGKFRRVPVVEDGRLVGIITDRDIRSVLLPEDVPERFKERFDLLRVRRVRDSMTRDPVTVSPDTPLDRAADLIRVNKIGGLPVVQEGWLVGIISQGDVLGGLLEAMGRRSDSLCFSLAVERGGAEAGIAPILKALEEAGTEVLSVVSGPDPASPQEKIHYSIRIGKADPKKIIPFLEKRGVVSGSISFEEGHSV